jgi:hypothetical protein
MSYKGKYRVKFPGKYKGNPNDVTYRSGMELKLMNFFDLHTDVLEWGSEIIVVPYRSPIDGRMHRYFVDMFARIKTKDGKESVLLIEVKPEKQSRPPVKKSRVTRRYIMEVKTWGVNQAKWEAASAYAEKRGWTFVVMGEKDIAGLTGF